jgi:hypothetical protein
MKIMTRFQPLLLILCVNLVAIFAFAAEETGKEKSHKLVSVSPRKLADSLHQLLAVQQELYVRRVVQPLAIEGKKVEVSQRTMEEGKLPGHAGFLRQTAMEIATQGSEFSFALRSLWPINPSQGPQTDIEKSAMEALVHNPSTNVYSEELLGGRSYFTAVYPCRASLTSCVDCHNKHAGAARRDFKTNELMGAIVIRLPLEF